MDKSFSGVATYEYPDGRVYSGDFVNGMPHGKGQMTFPNQDIYDGEWNEGKMHGQGEYRRFNIEKDKYVEWYIGEFVDGLMQGSGRIQFDNHMVYEGQWQNGRRTGVGTLWTSSSEYIHGLWKFDEIIRGVQHFENGDWYEGTFKNTQFHGFGRYFYSSGVLFDGEFENGKPTKGVSITPDGIITTIEES